MDILKPNSLDQLWYSSSINQNMMSLFFCYLTRDQHHFLGFYINVFLYD